jgi:hypothetical protein
VVNIRLVGVQLAENFACLEEAPENVIPEGTSQRRNPHFSCPQLEGQQRVLPAFLND